MIRPVDALLEFLQAEQARGVTHVHLDEAARVSLREIFLRSKGGQAPPQRQSPPEPPAASLAPPTKLAEDSLDHEEDAPVVAAATELVVGGGTRAEKLESLKRQAKNWAPGKALGSLLDVMVFSEGNPDARIMLVGDAARHHDVREGKPFAGPAGQKLNDILKAMGLTREEVYISNLVKFRPSAPRQSTNDRMPNAGEIAAFLPFLRAEIRIIRPTCVIALGEKAAEGLLGLTDSVANLRGQWHELEGTAVRVTYHPSHLMQSGGDQQTKRQIWEDMLAVMEKIDLPISPKQQGYFLPKV
ncbi:MAG: uracil-DNA glycosylase [Akkermansiaceae bacterium]|nr:uracil-DNA glycosylase [Akkermansiaceae bacterium]